MPLLTVATFREQWRLASELGASQLEGAVAFAERQVRGALETDVYADATASSPANDERARVLALVAGYWAMWAALPLIGARVRSDGIATHEASEIGRGLTYLTPEQIAQMRAEYRSMALLLIAPYTEVVGDESSFFSVGVVGAHRGYDLCGELLP